MPDPEKTATPKSKKSRPALSAPAPPAAPKTGDRAGLIALALAGVALLVRLYGIKWGLPETLEEATPLLRAWEMWGWGAHRPFDPNPHFFNYPSLTLYIQFLAQALLFAGMKLTGGIHSTSDFVARYVMDPTPVYVAGRLVTAAFGAATVGLTFLLGRRIGGFLVGLPAAFLLLVLPAHIAASQVIEVDVPLTFFVVLTLLQALRFLDRPALGSAVALGVFAGLAASTKYTGFFLIVPIAVACFLAGRRRPAPAPTRASASAPAPPRAPASAPAPPHASASAPAPASAPGSRKGRDTPVPNLIVLFVVAALAMGVTFALTSPFVFLDFRTFREHLGKEQVHMQLGHFGLAGMPTWLFYLKGLAARMLTIPGLILALAGLVLGLARRRGWAFILGSFVVPYLLVISSWEMHADRYLLPAVPVLLILAWSLLSDLPEPVAAKVTPRARAVTAGAAAVMLAVLAFAPNAGYLDRLKTDTRHLAREWIEKNAPKGSFIAMELQGPNLLDSERLWSLESEVRQKVETTGPIYAVQKLPLFQVVPERSAVFYDLRLYRMADLMVTSSLVSSRYLADPALFRPQVAFYDSLERHWPRVQVFEPGPGRTGPVITIYKNSDSPQPFARRTEVPGPAPLRQVSGPGNGRECAFYYYMGLNYETFGHCPGALEAYDNAFNYPPGEPGLLSNIVLGCVRCLISQGRNGDAVIVAERAGALAQLPFDKRAIAQILASVKGRR